MSRKVCVTRKTTAILFAAAAVACGNQSPTRPTATRAGQSPTTVAATTAPQNTSTRNPISFTLRGCPNLPAGMTVAGSGEEFLVTNSRVDDEGVTHLERNDLVTGTATDSEGASYRFNYHNHSNIEVQPGGFPFSFTTTDHFNLIGNGRANMIHVSFVARVTFPSPTDPPVAEFINSRGEPFFCDPI